MVMAEALRRTHGHVLINGHSVAFNQRVTDASEVVVTGNTASIAGGVIPPWKWTVMRKKASSGRIYMLLRCLKVGNVALFIIVQVESTDEFDKGGRPNAPLKGHLKCSSKPVHEATTPRKQTLLPVALGWHQEWQGTNLGRSFDSHHAHSSSAVRQ